jgi:tetratricopeptide (TPR) repeat protein
MKKFLTITVLLCLAITAIVILTSLQKPAPTPAPIATAATQSSAPHDPPTTRPASPRATSENTNRHSSRSFTAGLSRQPMPEDPASIAFKRALDTLVSPATSFQDKRAVWAQLREAGQLDQAIDALKQGATNNPDSAAYPAALGQAFLQKAGEVSRSGNASVNELGILGMSADQSFDNALKIDPANWEAQFYKAIAMSYWPAELNKGNEVVQRLSNLIDQQNTMPAQPEFANTYAVLGAQYQKLGQTDNAQQTWQAGLAKFPGDPALQQKVNAQ